MERISSSLVRVFPHTFHAGGFGGPFAYSEKKKIITAQVGKVLSFSDHKNKSLKTTGLESYSNGRILQWDDINVIVYGRFGGIKTFDITTGKKVKPFYKVRDSLKIPSLIMISPDEFAYINYGDHLVICCFSKNEILKEIDLTIVGKIMVMGHSRVLLSKKYENCVIMSLKVKSEASQIIVLFNYEEVKTVRSILIQSDGEVFSTKTFINKKNEEILATTGYKYFLRLYDIGNGALIKKISIKGKEQVYGKCSALISRNKYLAVGDSKGDIGIYDIYKTELSSIEEPVYKFSVAEEGATAFSNRCFKICEMKTKKKNSVKIIYTTNKLGIIRINGIDLSDFGDITKKDLDERIELIRDDWDIYIFGQEEIEKKIFFSINLVNCTIKNIFRVVM